MHFISFLSGTSQSPGRKILPNAPIGITASCQNGDTPKFERLVRNARMSDSLAQRFEKMLRIEPVRHETDSLSDHLR